MGVVPDLVALKFISGVRNLWLVNEAGLDSPTSPAGLYEEGERKFIVRLNKAELDDPMGLVGTIAHELAHVRLLEKADHP